MDAAVLLLAFGEPAEPDPAAVRAYLERIFLANAALEGSVSEAEARTRAETLAERRAPSLLEEYEAIGASPLNAQAVSQAEGLESELRGRGYRVRTVVGTQFTDPSIEDAVAVAQESGADTVVGLPVYPLCGPSTTIAALDRLAEALSRTDWRPSRTDVSGWHRAESYNRFRASNIEAFADRLGVDLTAAGTELVFSAHGTPRRYLEAGSRYREYVEEYCAGQADRLGVADYTLGYQNHENRGVAWTEPAIETAVESLDADRIVVEPVSFMHEQSETLAELDIDLRADAIDAGLAFHRVPVPHDDARFTDFLADLLEPILGTAVAESDLQACQCRAEQNTVCLNASRPDG